MILLTKDQENRLKKFGRYLAESDAYAINHYGHINFKYLREQIDGMYMHVSWPKKSGIKDIDAEKFAQKLGNELLLVGMNHIHGKCIRTQVNGINNYDKESLDWHDVVDAGKLCNLGWAIMYYGDG